MADDKQQETTGTYSRLMQDNPETDSERPNERSSERTNGGTNDRTPERSKERTDDRTNERSEMIHEITIPTEREKFRWSVDVFRDQRAALDTLLFAANEKDGKKESLGTLVQHALDTYIKQEAKRLGNVEIRREERG